MRLRRLLINVEHIDGIGDYGAESGDEVTDALAALRWSVNKAKPVEIATMTLRLLEVRSAPDGFSPLELELRVGAKSMTRPLAREHIETRGKSQWFRDNTWRLSPAGIAFFAPGLRDVLSRL